MSILRLMSIGLAALILAACSAEEHSLLKVGSNQWPGYEPMFLARDLGFYDENRIKLVELPSSTESLHLLHEGTLDAAALTLDEALGAMAGNTSISVVLVFDVSNGADVILASPSILTVQDLKGRKVGVESTAVGAIVLYSALKKAGLAETDVELSYLTVDEHVHAYTKGEVDAVVTFEPSKTKLLRQGAHVLFDSREIAGLIVDVLVVRTDQLNEQMRNIQMLIDGYYKARQYMREQPDHAMTLMAPRLGMSPQALRDAYQGLKLPDLSENQALFSGEPSPFESSANEVLKVMSEAKM
ncbi:MAG: ABC transporter substrate-binding protein, partial [Mariprofundaceae bacterium]